MNRRASMPVSRGCLVSAALVLGIARAAAADPLPPIALSCGLPRTTDLSEFCAGTSPSSTNLLCNATGTWDGSQTFSGHCESAVNPMFTFDSATHTTNGPYLVLGLQMGQPATSQPFEATDTHQASAGATYSIRVTSLTLGNNMTVPIRMPLMGSLRAAASHGTARIVASAFGGNLAAAFSACDPITACAGGASSLDFNEVIRFQTPVNRPNVIRVTINGDIDGPLDSNDPNGAGAVSGFVDPLPELDTEADPTQFGLPNDWRQQVTLEISPGATTTPAGGDAGAAVDAGAPPDGGSPADAGSPAGDTGVVAPTSDAGTAGRGGGCSAAGPRGGGTGASSPLGIAALGVVAFGLARRRRIARP